MNNLEAEYASQLRARQIVKEIAWFAFEPFKLRLADSTTYTPDFAVMLADGELQVHECKGGFVREDSWIKLKLAAEIFPFRFIMAQYTRENGWNYTEI